MSAKPYLDLLRLSVAEASQIASELKHADAVKRRKDNRRAHERLPFGEDALLLCEIKGQRSEGPSFLVKCVNISAGGLGFLHGAYVHVQTPCIITLILRNKKGFRQAGRVARCIHLRDHIHLVGVQFDEPMETAQLSVVLAEK